MQPCFETGPFNLIVNLKW